MAYSVEEKLMRMRGFGLILIIVVCVALLFLPDNSYVLSIAVVEGEVTVASEQGVSRQAHVGERLKLRDQISTGEFGKTTIMIGEDSTVSLPSNSQVTLTDISKQSLRVELDSGALSAVIRPTSGVLTLAADGRQLVSSDASLRMQLFDGGLTVDVIDGTVEAQGLSGMTSLEAGKRVMARNGEESVVSRRAGEMLLSVAWPETRRTRAEQVRVEGKTEPGAWRVPKSDAPGPCTRGG